MKRVVVTGTGTISSSGTNSDELWLNVSNGVSGIKYITANDFKNSNTRIGGIVESYNLEPYIDKKDIKKTDRFTHFAMIGAIQALEQANFLKSDFSMEKCGVIIGTGIGGIHSLLDNQQILNLKGNRRVSPLLVPKMIANMASGFVSIKTGFQGVSMSPISACATGNQAIGEAYLKIKYGINDAILAGGTEASITPLSFAGFNNMNAMSIMNDDPTHASRPFDENRTGFVMSEGSGIVFLEELSHAKSRGATILGEVLGYGMTSDAYHMTSPSSEGAVRAMKEAIAMSKLTIKDIDYINAHATGTGIGDISETNAIKKVFEEEAHNLFISSTKSATGHLLGAAGGIESIITLKAMENNILPPTINLDKNDDKCDLNYIPNKKIIHKTNVSLSNGFGFGGHNATLILSKYFG